MLVNLDVASFQFYNTYMMNKVVGEPNAITEMNDAIASQSQTASGINNFYWLTRQASC